MHGIQTILHPTDFSENARPAFETACAMARDSHATLLVLHVMTPSASPLMSGPPPSPLKTAESQGSHWQLPWPEPPDRETRIEHRLVEGDPAEEIVRLAAAEHCDLIVIGTHGRTGLGRLLTGSVAEEVLRNAVCQVLVVKTSHAAAPGAAVAATAKPGDPIDVRPLGTSLARAHTRTLLRTAAIEVVRLIVRAGQESEIPGNLAKAETIVHCLEGRVAVTALGKTQTLEAGRFLDLPAGEPHSFKGLEDTSLLLTGVVAKR